MPAFIEPLVKILPLTFVNDALRQIMVAGTPMHSMTTDIAVLAAWAIGCLAITIRFFRWD
jgi:ABC-2 type transport system permease protein